MKSNNNESIFLKTDGKLGVGLNNSSPSAPIDFFDGITSGNTKHMLFYPNDDGTIESTGQMMMHFATGRSFWINEGSYISGTSVPRLSLNGSDMNVYANLTAEGRILSISATTTNDALKVYNSTSSTTNFLVYNSGKTIMGYQSGASNGAMFNLNVPGASSPTDAFDVFDQYTTKLISK